jgi:hypothetical protein
MLIFDAHYVLIIEVQKDRAGELDTRKGSFLVSFHSS